VLAGSLLLCVAMLLGGWDGVEASSVITHGSRGRPWVALTFDDGWSADRCASIARTLRARHATATFLINGAIIAGAPARWRSILDGFSIANHTRTHPFLTELGPGAIRSEIASNETVIERALGRPMLHLLRPPYGAYDSQVVSIADHLGYRTILWDTSGEDTSSSATTSSVIHNAIQGGSGSIVLLHCGPAVTPAAVGPIIESYRARGYRLVDLGRMLGVSVPPRPDACRVRNIERDVTRGRLQTVVALSRPGNHLTVRGTCHGRAVLDRDLHVRGTRTESSGPPTLDGDGRGSVLTIRRGPTVTLADVHVIGGSDPEGGGILNAGDLSLRSVVVRGNRARYGAGIYNRLGAVLRLSDATAIHHNVAARDGGGVWSDGFLALRGTTTIRGNRATRAGGVWNDSSGTLNLRGESAIRANTARRFGGGAWTRGQLAMQEGSSIRANAVSLYTGGGLYIAGGTLTGVTCAPQADANVHGNAPDDCEPPPG
jgi:peptidoglycan/xylan/chitin deacetylase (PgdA/CDA1 family)